MRSWCFENFQSSLSTRTYYFPTFLVHDTTVLSPCTKWLLCPANDVVWANQIKVKFHYKQHHVWHSRVLKHSLGFQSSEFSFQFCHKFMRPSLLRWCLAAPVWGMSRAAQLENSQAGPGIGSERWDPLANQTLVFLSSCSVSQLSIWLFPLHTLSFCHWFEQAFTLGTGSYCLNKHDLRQDSDSVTGIWKEAVLWGICSSWRSAFVGAQWQHPFLGYLCVQAHTRSRLLPGVCFFSS